MVTIFVDDSGNPKRVEENIKKDKDPFSLAIIAFNFDVSKKTNWLKIINNLIDFNDIHSSIAYEHRFKTFHFSDFINNESNNEKANGICINFLKKIKLMLNENNKFIWIKSCLVPSIFKTKDKFQNIARRLIYCINSIPSENFYENAKTQKIQIVLDNIEFVNYFKKEFNKKEYEKNIESLKISKRIDFEWISFFFYGPKHPLFFIPDWIAGITKRAYNEHKNKNTNRYLCDFINNEINVKGQMKIIDYSPKLIDIMN